MIGDRSEAGVTRRAAAVTDAALDFDRYAEGALHFDVPFAFPEVCGWKPLWHRWCSSAKGKRVFEFRVILPAASAVFCVLAATAAISSPPSQKKIGHEFTNLHWSSGRHALTASKGTFAVPKGAIMVQGVEAGRADELVNGTSSSDTEGVVLLRDGRSSMLYMSYQDSGYVSLDDWKDLDAAAMLKDMADNTTQANEERTKNGSSPLFVDGWVRSPVLDKTQNSVRWIVKLHDDRGPFLNAIAVKLGRHGFERFTLATNVQSSEANTLLDSLTSDYQFQPGFRFTDYVKGDKLADYGIAALVGVVAGATITKVVGWGALLLLIKKFFIVIIAAVGAAFAGLRKLLFGSPIAPPPANRGT